ncbi:MAG: cytochrome c oxidase subunit I, partial [Rhodothermaceae bacterium]|nr:cytochrome c oxidase subunit I [Rhodothermaceae bacterium]
MSDESHNYLNASKGLWSWLSTTDHKRIGIMYAIACGAFFLLGGILATFVRTELGEPGETILGQDQYN